jgi:hypothetical protein
MEIKTMTRSAYCLTATLLLAMTLTGCQKVKRPVTAVNKIGATETIDQDKKQREAERIQQCQHELEAMRNMDPEKYKKFKLEFDTLMSGAAQYAGVRSSVTMGTQETVDSLYRYRISRTCADISATMMTSLAERGERIQ